MLNLLSDPLVRIEKDDGATVLASLPETLALLMNDEVLAFPALRPHQRHPWHAFLVQLAAMAMCQAGVSEPPADAAEWAGLIRGLTPEFPGDEPWHLVVDDITKPAFMQAGLLFRQVARVQEHCRNTRRVGHSRNVQEP